ncbi:Probable chromosome-partitioning protein parB [Actinomyces bovis]|uniref:Probable chromosome-partitioning protein parB n=1 Tax=Actinomyces bovis TaxID=1658 RepID=A0ABY1VRV8_9ACTO|nr:ParB/RepB/Spo0J family partition protein [Actinomyces bovis]SPT54407.1 Probable chromosome-partitioning protein parB [Actinomyces bovis]VEG56022.1 Probable chromosome-partitioning protein parB [Actinomyces israelii]
MAEKRRALGRGLEALMPSAQAEPVGRPSDVFFPEGSRRSATAAKGTTTKENQAEDRSRSQSASHSDLAAKLLAPSKRTTKHSKKAPTRSAKPAAVSRETEVEAEVKTASGAKTSAAKTTASQAPAVATKRAAVKQSAAVKASKTATPESKAARPESCEVEAVAEKAPVAEVKEAARTVTEAAEELAPAETGAVFVEAESEPALVSRETEATDEGLVPVPGATFGHIPLDHIDANPRQPRQYFDDEEIEELAASIKEVGLLQPVVVRRSPDTDDDDPRYELIMGERRTRAARVAGLETIPAIVRYTDDQDLLRDALLENLHRVQLNPLEEAAAYKALLEDFGCTHAELSKRIARSRSQISNTLRLMKLPALVQRRVAAGVLSAGHARALLGLPDAGAMERLAQKIVAEGLSVRAAEELVAMHDEPEDVTMAPRPQRLRSMPLPALSTRLSDAFETRVKVTRSAKKGKITIEFAGDEDLARIVDALAPGTSLAED